ncbi:MAG: PBECR2 nuclease fold domain-containing protein [Defluviitaleaceae bacterium]|nr:PBECR2 nuclease fold domain-containing protein [Defluviitaleaceae bacterium]
MNTLTKVGEISQRVIDLLTLDVEAGTPIYLSPSNIEHMIDTHPHDFENYGTDLENIIEYPDYVGINPRDNSIEYVKLFQVQNKEYIKVAVRVSAEGNYFARSLYSRDVSKMERFIKKGYLLTYWDKPVV